MKKVFSYYALCLTSGCMLSACNPTGTARGVLTDVTGPTTTIVTEQNDTLSFSIPDDYRDKTGELHPGDTLAVVFEGTYRQGMDATRITVFPRSRAIGGNRDEHGCLTSAGYTWCEVLHDCIRLFEKGIRTEATDGSRRSAYIVFAPDSTQTELFFSDSTPNEILQRRRLPSGTYIWNAEDDDTKTVRLINGIWSIGQRGKTLFETKRDTLTDGLGDMQQHTYRGLLPAASGPGIEYTLTVSHRLHSGDGTFTLILTYKEADNGQDRSFTYRGKRLTLRGIPGNDDATVWQCIADDGQETFNFLKEDETTLTLLNSDFEKPRTQLNYSLRLVE